MGQAKLRAKEIEQLKAQHPTHTGIDLFFSNITEDQSKEYCKFLNELGRTMGGHLLVWTLDWNDNKAAITARYPGQPYSREYSLTALTQNRIWAETGLKYLNMSNVKYTGSEFYVQFPSQESMKSFYKDMDNLFNRVA